VLSLDQKQLKDALEVHLKKKFGELSEGQIPSTVHSSQQSMKMTLPPPEKSPSQIKQSDLAPMMGSDPNIPKDISLPDSDKQMTLEDHSTIFHMRMISGLPQRVQESINNFNKRGRPSQAYSALNFPSSTTLISEVDSKLGVSRSLRGNSNAYVKEKMGTRDPIPILDSIPAASPGSKEGQGSQRQSFSDIKNEPIDNLHKMKQLFPQQTQTVIEKASEKQPVAGNRCIPNLPIRASEAAPETGDKRLSSSNTIQKSWGERMFSISDNSGETFKAEELSGLQSQPNAILTTRERGKSPVIYANPDKAESTLTTEKSPRGTLVPHYADVNSRKVEMTPRLMKYSRGEHQVPIMLMKILEK
jgi:hypothetical protein